MRALQVKRLDGPDAIELVDIPEPDPGDGVLIDVVAAGVAFPDALRSRGLYQSRQELPFVPGADVAGIVRSAPAGATVSPGERVMALTSGTFAETAVAPVDRTFRIPDRLSFTEAAGFVLNHQTAHFGLHRRGRLSTGETVLVHGAAGGVGSATVQLAKAAGARVIAATSTEEKSAVARRAGADEGVLTSGDWLAAVRELTDGHGVDVVMDPVGGARFDTSVRCLAPEGRLLVVGFTSGEIPQVKVNRLLLRNIDIVGVYAIISREIADDLERLVDRGAVRPLVGAVYPLEEGAQALRDIENRTATGKLVIRVREDAA